MYDQDVISAGELYDWQEIGVQPEIEVWHQSRRRRRRQGDREDCLAIRWLLEHLGRPDRANGADLVLDYDMPAFGIAEIVCNDATDNIWRRAGGISIDDADHAGWIGLRPKRRHHCQRTERRQQKSQGRKMTSGRLHHFYFSFGSPRGGADWPDRPHDQPMADLLATTKRYDS